MFIGYANHSATYRFIVLRSEVLNWNIVIKTTNVKYFENIFSLSEKISHTLTIKNNFKKKTNKALRNSKP